MLHASGDTAIVARVAYVENRRDIQVLARSASGWACAGDRGGAVAGADGTPIVTWEDFFPR